MSARPDSIRTHLVKVLMLTIVAITARAYAQWAIQNAEKAGWIVFGHEIRPYVYRAFVPFMARILVMLGMSPEQALIVVVVASAIGLVYGIKYLLQSFTK